MITTILILCIAGQLIRGICGFFIIWLCGGRNTYDEIDVRNGEDDCEAVRTVEVGETI